APAIRANHHPYGTEAGRHRSRRFGRQRTAATHVELQDRTGIRAEVSTGDVDALAVWTDGAPKREASDRYKGRGFRCQRSAGTHVVLWQRVPTCVCEVGAFSVRADRGPTWAAARGYRGGRLGRQLPALANVVLRERVELRIGDVDTPAIRADRHPVWVA